MKRQVTLFTLALCVLTAPAVLAKANLGLKNIGGAVGYVSPEGLEGTFTFGAFADWGTIAPGFGLESRLDYWSQSDNVFGFESSVRDITLGARSKYYFDVASPKVRPFAGAGLAMHFIRSEVTIPIFPGFPAMTTSNSDTEFGLDLGGGLATAIGPRTDFLGEAWYGVVSNANQLQLRVGVSYRLGK